MSQIKIILLVSLRINENNWGKSNIYEVMSDSFSKNFI